MTSIAKQEPKSPIQALKAELTTSGFQAALADAVPVTARKYLPPERIVRIVTAAANKNPTLLQCDPRTILAAVIDCVQLGLEPGGPLGHAYLVPYKGRCTPIIGYQGYIALARRSGEIASIFAQVAYQRDSFSVQYGDDPHVKHSPCLTGDRGDPVAAYCVARFADGGKHIEVMTLDEIEAIRRRSTAGEKGPWVSDWSQMARKTVIRRARHYWPISVEMAQAAELDDRVDAGTYVPSGPVVDGGDLDEAPAKKPKSKAVLERVQKQQAEPPHDERTGEVEPEAQDWSHVGPPPMSEDPAAG